MLVKRLNSIITVSMLSGAIALLFTACTEKKAAPTNESGDDGKADESDDTDGGEDEGDDDETEEAGDMCSDGVEKAGLPGTFDSLMEAFCGDYRSDIEKSSGLYNQGDYDADDASADKKKILVKDEEEDKDKDELAYLMFASNELDANAKDYFELNKLRNNKPDVYKNAGFKVNEDTRVCNVEPGDDSTKYEVENDAEKDLVKYTAEAKYKKVSTGIYVIYTELDDNFGESLRDLKTFTVILAKGDKKSLVYTAAYQVAFRNNQSSDTVLDKAKNNLREEMRRNFSNAGKADTVDDLKEEESDPPKTCAKP